MAAGVLNDLFVYDPHSFGWTDYTSEIAGNIPSPRFGHGFTNANGKLYVQGGHSINNGIVHQYAAYCSSFGVLLLRRN